MSGITKKSVHTLGENEQNVIVPDDFKHGDEILLQSKIDKAFPIKKFSV
ncbi:MAG: hypothetical protein FWG55_02145 [Candidatus Bathyarchaeota archaeon]|nr:hypothetical protein [Candidatus Termiticorpusculum sp.]